MIDVIGSLAKRKSIYIRRKENAKKEYEAVVHECDAELAKIDEAIKQVNSALEPYICNVCHGTGEETFMDAAGSRDTKECSACGGTGVKKG